MTDSAALQKTLDVIAIGRSSVDLYGQQIGCRLEDVGSFAKSVGGCPANIAIGTARLGLKSALITRVGAEQMGGFIREQLVREGVAIDGVRVDKRAADRVWCCSPCRPKAFRRPSSIAPTARTWRWTKATSTKP